MKQRKILTPANILGFIVGSGILAFLLFQIRIQEIAFLFSKIDYRWFFAGAILYLSKTVIRTMRFMSINHIGRNSFFSMLHILLAMSLATQVLPLRLGDLSYVYLARKEHDIPVASGLISIIFVRMLDLLALGIIFSLSSLLYYQHLPGEYIAYLDIVLILTLLGIVVLTLFFFFYGRLGSLTAGLFKKSNVRILCKLNSFFERLTIELNAFSQLRTKAFLFVLPLLEWFINYLLFHVLLISLGIYLDFFITIIGVTFTALTTILPISSFGNFGTHEAGWTAGFLLLGMDQNLAISSGITIHLLLIIYTLILGGLSLLYLFRPIISETEKDVRI